MPDGPYDPGGAFGDNPYQVPGQIPGVQLAPPLPVLATIAITVTYVPNPLTAALDITEAGVDEGAYPCIVSGPAADGITYTLTASLTSIPAGLAPGPVSIQAGDLVAGVFVPAAVNGVAVPPSTGRLTVLGAGAPLPDIAVTLGAAQADVTDTAPFPASSGGYVHVPVSAVSQVDDVAVDLSAWAVLLAITRGDPQPSDFQPGDWLLVTAPPSAAGLYARLAVSTAAGTALAASNYRVYVQLLAPQGTGTLTRRCPGYLAVQN